jgi:hypothetical protein
MELRTTWQNDGILLIDTIDLGRWVSGELWLSLPKEPITVTCYGEGVEVKVQQDGIYALQLGFLNKARIEVLL